MNQLPAMRPHHALLQDVQAGHRNHSLEDRNSMTIKREVAKMSGLDLQFNLAPAVRHWTAAELPRHPHQSREEALETFDKLCKDAAAVELAELIVGPNEMMAPEEPCQRARTVADLLLSSSKDGSAPWQPPHLCRLFMLRRARRRERAVRQVKTVLALRAELLLQARDLVLESSLDFLLV